MISWLLARYQLQLETLPFFLPLFNALAIDGALIGKECGNRALGWQSLQSGAWASF